LEGSKSSRDPEGKSLARKARKACKEDSANKTVRKIKAVEATKVSWITQT